MDTFDSACMTVACTQPGSLTICLLSLNNVHIMILTQNLHFNVYTLAPLLSPDVQALCSVIVWYRPNVPNCEGISLATM